MQSKMDYKRIIMVEDNETSLFVNHDVLEDLFPGIEIIEYTNSQEFIDDALKHEKWYTESTLLLLDINMPGKFGFDVLDEIEESRNELKEMDIIMVTSSNLKRDMEASTKFENVLGYIIKPLSEIELRKVLNSAKLGAV